MTNGNNNKNKRGPKPLPLPDKRTHTVSSRLNIAELQQLDIDRGCYQRGEYLRMCSVGKVAPIVPAINQDAWFTLSKVSGNLSTLATAMRAGEYEELNTVREAVKQFRLALLGVEVKQ